MPRGRGAQQRRSERTVWLVFSPDGRFLGAVPGGARPDWKPGQKHYQFEAPAVTPEPGRITRLRVQEGL